MTTRGILLPSSYYFTLVTLTHHAVHSSNAKFDGDQHAEDFARKALDAADLSVVAVEAWERSRLVCRIERRSR
jgi:hypothetical protein